VDEAEDLRLEDAHFLRVAQLCREVVGEVGLVDRVGRGVHDEVLQLDHGLGLDGEPVLEELDEFGEREAVEAPRKDVVGAGEELLALRLLLYEVQGLGFGIWDLEFKVEGSG